MHAFSPMSDNLNVEERARILQSQLQAILSDERDFIANLANAASLIFHSLPGLNWAGFYLLRENELVLGPFQGKPACTRIALTRGVCGAAASQRKTVIVPDVYEFPGHIACDSASQSEIVIPMLHCGELVGVLDLDSPRRERFDEADAALLQGLVQILLAGSDMDRWFRLTR